LSPLVQVKQQPLSVISHLQAHIVMLQQQTVMPFIVQQNEHIPPIMFVQRFCMTLQAISSSHEQVTFMPPVHFSTFMVQRGTIGWFIMVGMPIPDIAVGMVIVAGVIIIEPVMAFPPFRSAIGDLTRPFDSSGRQAKCSRDVFRRNLDRKARCLLSSRIATKRK
jgi:hypothetical protein